MREEDQKTVADLWDQSRERYSQANLDVYWECVPLVFRYQNETMTGDPAVDYFSHTLEHLKARVGNENLRGLSIGCNEGNPGREMILYETGMFQSIEVLDIARPLLERQRDMARARGLDGIDYVCCDLDCLALEPEAYDFIWAVGTIHHVERLENLFRQVNRGLSRRGLFMMREYVGPSRLQFTPAQLAVVNEILAALPEAYKRTPGGKVKEGFEGYDVEAVKAHDPSESVRSAEIMDSAAGHLEIIRLAPTGGTLLHPLLSDIAYNFERDKTGEALTAMIILLEKVLIREKVLPSDYVFCLAGKRPE